MLLEMRGRPSSMKIRFLLLAVLWQLALSGPTAFAVPTVNSAGLETGFTNGTPTDDNGLDLALSHWALSGPGDVDASGPGVVFHVSAPDIDSGISYGLLAEVRTESLLLREMRDEARALRQAVLWGVGALLGLILSFHLRFHRI